MRGRQNVFLNKSLEDIVGCWQVIKLDRILINHQAIKSSTNAFSAKK